MTPTRIFNEEVIIAPRLTMIIWDYFKDERLKKSLYSWLLEWISSAYSKYEKRQQCKKQQLEEDTFSIAGESM